VSRTQPDYHLLRGDGRAGGWSHGSSPVVALLAGVLAALLAPRRLAAKETRATPPGRAPARCSCSRPGKSSSSRAATRSGIVRRRRARVRPRHSQPDFPCSPTTLPTRPGSTAQLASYLGGTPGLYGGFPQQAHRRQGRPAHVPRANLEKAAAFRRRSQPDPRYAGAGVPR